MKRVLSLLVALAAVGSLGAAYFITQDQALVSGVLTELKLEAVPGKPGIVGAPPKFKITKETIEHLQKLQKDGKLLEVQNNGQVKAIGGKN